MNISEFRIGDRVQGRYSSHNYTGVIANLDGNIVEVRRDDHSHASGKPLWSCKIRDNGEVAAAWGCDDGIHNLELLEAPIRRRTGFNVGDKVRIIRRLPGNNSGDGDSVNVKGIITKLTRNDGSAAFRPEEYRGRDVYEVWSADGKLYYGFFDLLELELISSSECIKKKTKTMSVIKDIFKSKEQKALAYYGVTNGDGGLTPSGREEFLDYLWEMDKETKKAFIAKIVEQYEEDKKRR